MFPDFLMPKLRLRQTFVGVLQKKKNAYVLLSRKPPQTTYQQKGYKNVEFDKIKVCFAFCFPKAAEAVNSKMTD